MELFFDFSKVSVKNERGTLVLTGTTVKPVIWDYRIAVDRDEIPALLKVLGRKATASFLLRYLWNVLTFRSKSVTEEKEEEIGQTVLVKVVDQDSKPLTVPIFIENKPCRDNDTPILEAAVVKAMARSEILGGRFLRWETDGGATVEKPDSNSTCLKVRAFGTLTARYQMQKSLR